MNLLPFLGSAACTHSLVWLVSLVSRQVRIFWSFCQGSHETPSAAGRGGLLGSRGQAGPPWQTAAILRHQRRAGAEAGRRRPHSRRRWLQPWRRLPRLGHWRSHKESHVLGSLGSHIKKKKQGSAHTRAWLCLHGHVVLVRSAKNWTKEKTGACPVNYGVCIMNMNSWRLTR